jgi:hypothetical protein
MQTRKFKVAGRLVRRNINPQNEFGALREPAGRTFVVAVSKVADPAN